MNNCNSPMVLSILLLFALSVSAQNKKEYNLARSLREKKLIVYNRSAELVNNQNDIVKLDENKGEGLAWVNTITLSTGTIEADLRGKDEFQKSFIGIAFHALNDSTYDAIYFRPFNFYSKDSIRKIHAVQYISQPQYTWKKLREEHNGLYEKGLVSPPDPNNWFHIRIEVTAVTLKVFVNQDSVPSLTIDKLDSRKDGKVGLWVGDGSGGEFKNLIITKN